MVSKQGVVHMFGVQSVVWRMYSQYTGCSAHI